MSTLAVGIDVSKATLVAAIWQQEQGRLIGEFDNSPSGRQQLIARLRVLAAEAETVQIVFEPTGGYEAHLRHDLQQTGWSLSQPNPRLVRDWARGLGQRAKTDAQDALLLAHFAAARARPEAPVAAEIEALESLTHRRRQLEKMLQQERNRLEGLRQRPTRHPEADHSLGRVIETLEQELAAVEQAIQQHLRTQGSLAQDTQRLRGVPGIGPKVSQTLVVHYARFEARTNGTGNHKELTAHSGLDPTPHTSGSSVQRRARISRQGDSETRRLLYFAALGAIRGHNPARRFYEDLVARGKAPQLALVALGRKILIWGWAVYRSGETFDPSRHPMPRPKPI